MSLNLGGPTYFNPDSFGDNNQNIKNSMANTAKAVLYVFNPYENQFVDIGMRPFQYRFDDNFISDTKEMSALAMQGKARAGPLVADLMQSPRLSDNMMSSYAAPMQFRASHLSSRHRFILILTESASGLVNGNHTLAATGSSSQMRRIYTGFFTDEPMNFRTFSDTKHTLNPNAMMVITHKTVVGTTIDMGGWGSRTNINSLSSEEIIHPELSNTLIGRDFHKQGGLFLMTPENCMNSIEEGTDGITIAVPGAHSDITRDKGTLVASDLLEQPKHNVTQIVKGMIRNMEDQASKGRLSMNRGESWLEDEFMEGAADRRRLARYMSLPRWQPTSIFDLDINSQISPQTLSDMVNGELHILPIEKERPQYYETADQMEASFTNQYSSLIASVVGPVLNAAGMNAMQFTYEVVKRNNQKMDNFQTHSAEANWPVPNQDLVGMTTAVEYELVNGILDTIFHAMGAFHVLVNANATGMTSVRLNLVDQGYRSAAAFEIPTCLGGLISPLLGDIGSNTHNSEQVENLYSTASGTNTSVYQNFNDNDKDFMKLADRLTGIGDNWSARPGDSHGWKSQMTVDPNENGMTELID